jgi:uncharacterized membrane protein YgcG
MAGASGSSSAPWVPARDRTDARTAIRIVLGLAAVFIAVLAVLALLNSFFIETAPGPRTPTDPGPGEQPGEQGGEGDRDVTCQDVVDFLMWVFLGTSGITLVLLGLAVALRRRADGRILTSVWGILAIIGLFFTLLAAGAWRLMDWMCNGAPTCTDLIDGFWVTFLVLICLTVGSVAFGITFAHLRRISFFRTGFGVLGVVLYLPALLTGVIWWVLRTFCNPQLWAEEPCVYLQDTMTHLAWIFWVSLAGGVVALAVGIVYQLRTKVGVFRSGWAILSVMLIVLAALSGAGWLGVKEIHDAIPLCNPQEEQPPEEEEEEEPTCQDILDRIAMVFWIMLGIAVLLIALGLVFNHKDLRDFLTSIWTILAYVVLALAILVGLIFLIVSSFCDGEGDDPGGGGDGTGPGDGGGGGGGGGPGGGGGGGSGPVVPRPVAFNPLPLSWVLIVLAAVLAVGILVLMLRRRPALGKGGVGPGAPPDAEVSAEEKRRLARILAKRSLDSAEAIVAAYRVYLAWAAGNDLAKEPWETPTEHARRVTAKYDVDRDVMREFVAAYEVARMSSRTPTDKERELAIRFSKEILRDDGPRQEATE